MHQVLRSARLRRLFRMRRALAGSSSTHVMRKPSSSSSDKKSLSTGERGKVSPTAKPGDLVVDGDEKDTDLGTTRRGKGKKERKDNGKLRNGRGKGKIRPTVMLL